MVRPLDGSVQPRGFLRVPSLWQNVSMASPRVSLLLIHAAHSDEALPLGAACVAAALARAGGPRARLVEAWPEEPLERLAARILEDKPDILGISLYLWNRKASIALAQLLREMRPALRLFCGGPDASARPQGLALQAYEGIDGGGPFDLVVRGEGEGAAGDLAAWMAGEESASPGGGAQPIPAILSPAPLDGGELVSPWLDGSLDMAGRDCILWELARGCPWACSYCYESRGTRRLRRLPDERLAAELELIASSGVSSVFVLDPSFNADGERAIRILDQLLAQAAKPGATPIHWHFEVRAEQLTRAQARRFARLGASLQIGLQSASEAVCAAINRPFKAGPFASKIALLNEEGCIFGLDLMYGLPEDSLAGFRKSVDWALGLWPNNLDIFPLALLPGTALHEQAAELGLEADSEPPYLLRSTRGFSPADLASAALLSKAVDVFYNKGRAVPWFLQILNPLGLKPVAFLEGFARFVGSALDTAPRAAGFGSPETADPVAIERLQLAWIDEVYTQAKLDWILPAVWDLVRFHGACARALAEGLETRIDTQYDLEEVSSEEALDLEAWAAEAQPDPGRWVVSPGPDGPDIRRIS